MVRKAVSVLPEPVGEQSNRCPPSIMVGIANFCGRVKSGNFSLNQFRTGGHNLSIRASVSVGCSRYVISGIFFSPISVCWRRGEIDMSVSFFP